MILFAPSIPPTAGALWHLPGTCLAHTSAVGFAVVPGPIFGAAEGGGGGGLHQEAGVALVTHGLVEGEVSPKLEAVGQATRVSAADDCVTDTGQRDTERSWCETHWLCLVPPS